MAQSNCHSSFAYVQSSDLAWKRVLFVPLIKLLPETGTLDGTGDVQRNLLRCGHLLVPIHCCWSGRLCLRLRQRKNKIHISRFIASYRVRILRANEHNKRGTCFDCASRVHLHTFATVRNALHSEPPQRTSAAIVVHSHSTECQSETNLSRLRNCSARTHPASGTSGAV